MVLAVDSSGADPCSAADGIAFAKPKSISFAPDFVSMMLPGFKSRWTIAALCAVSELPRFVFRSSTTPAAALPLSVIARRSWKKSRKRSAKSGRCIRARSITWSPRACLRTAMTRESLFAPNRASSS